ncbi:nucleotide-binding universal stress UspA family protein [Tamaricihabitans halophyticus]|uniref:Nucleotide-binding universal stress UspA family protein n=1 Tax=Tamaricihabitans halophyticus TaxID=1262583 RepID=A0A4R2QIJ8_9PSEU|nr:universal stress protein [Tamaricihabitans halophyticus]TCP48599.1 nucleotide-binding universal stress UspA family protein [Tamaricihabitans halophyticus]
MSMYHTVVVGTDGSDSSLHAVARAAELAGTAGATLVIACAYFPTDEREVAKARDELGDDVAYQVVGSNPAEDTVRRAAERARAHGATKIDTVAVSGKPVETLLKVVAKHEAELLVVGNRGLRSLAGRILGSVPSEAARRSRTDVLIVHTT